MLLTTLDFEVVLFDACFSQDYRAGYIAVIRDPVTSTCTVVLTTPESGMANLRATAIWTLEIEVLGTCEQSPSFRMLLTRDLQTVSQETLFLQQVKKWNPAVVTASGRHECVHVAVHDEAISSSGEKDIQALRGFHESYVAISIAASKRCNDNIALFSLVVV